MQTAEECMLKIIAQSGIWGSMAEDSVVFSSSSVTSNGELSVEDLAEYSSLKMNHWLGKIYHGK